MKKIIFLNFVIFVSIFLSGCTYFVNNKTKVDKNYYNISIDNKTINIDKSIWNKMNDTEIYAKNFETKENVGKYTLVSTFFLNKILDSKKSEFVSISKDEYLEIFSTSTSDTVFKVVLDRGNYWILGRATYDVSNKDCSKPLLKNGFIDESKFHESSYLFEDCFDSEINTIKFFLNSF